MIALNEIIGLGTSWSFELFDAQSSDAEAIRTFLQTEITKFDHNYSRFRADSWIGKLNQDRAVSQPTPEFLELLQYGLWLNTITAGAVNFLTGHIQEAQGYDGGYSFCERELSELELNPHKELACTTNKVALKRGVLDLGAYGKGFLIDRLTNLLKTEWNVEELLINGGGDMYATHENGNPVEVFLEHPLHRQHYIARVPLHFQALGASSTYKRVWRTKNKGIEKTHIIAPHAPAQHLQAASFTVASTAVLADSMATLLCVKHPDQLRDCIPDDVSWLHLDEKQRLCATADLRSCVVSQA